MTDVNLQKISETTKYVEKKICSLGLVHLPLLRMAVKKYVAVRLEVIYDSPADQ
jgi:hypothetical protein